MIWSVFCFGVLVWAVEAGSEAVCTNGSFEQLDQRNFPADWGPVGRTVELTNDTHTGQKAVRLLRTAATPPTVETGLNRGKLIDRVQGGMEFWYKAVAGHSAKLRIMVIPVGVEGREGTGSLRAEYVVPLEHVGDGQWHQARIHYDYSDNPKVHRVHFAARITGQAGELLLDDIRYLERTGPILRISPLRWEENSDRPGERAVLAVKVENTGDAPAETVRITLRVPEGLKVHVHSGQGDEQKEPQPATSGSAAKVPRVPALGTEVSQLTLAPGQSAWMRWTIEGSRTQPGIFEVRGSTADTEAMARLEVAPKMVLRSFGPTRPVAIVGQPIKMECVVENPGQAILTGADAELRLPSGPQKFGFPPIRPGRWVSQAVEFVPEQPTDKLAISLSLRAPGISDPIQAESELMVLPVQPLPQPTGRLHAATGERWAVLENQYLRLVFPRAVEGFGPAELQVKKSEHKTAGQAENSAHYVPVAWFMPLSRLVWNCEGAQHSETLFASEPPQAEIASSARLVFTWTKSDAQNARWQFTAAFSLGPEDRTVAIEYTLQCDKPQKLLHFQGPVLSIFDRQEAIFPGLEWLVEDEVSSSSLDIAEDHPHRQRMVVHPQMITIPAIGVQTRDGVVGLLWDNRPRVHRPAVIFDSPDRHNHRRTHWTGLFLPSLPEYVEPNELRARRPYPLEPGKPLRIQCQVYADGASQEALTAVEEWIRRYGLPEPTPLPHGSYEQEIAFSMQGYLRSLWDEASKQWWTSKGGGMLSRQGRPAAFVADLLLGELLSPDRAVAAACRARAEEVAHLLGTPVRLDAQRFPGRFDLAVANPNQAAHALLSRHEDGTWRFDADLDPKEGPFVGRDYHQLGPDEAVEVGTCARRAYEVLRYARIAGDMDVYRSMVPTLEAMERFRVPRAAQVWEVPVHTPDLLAAADAVDAFLEAYWLSGDRRWLDDAVFWARRGLPFIYLWEDPEKPFLLGASIPVFGASWHESSWFGRPVQWNGLRYAAALLKLAPYDQTHPWRKLATMIIHSGIHQQAPEGEDVALWPDSISAIDSQRSSWVFAPRQILECMSALLDRPEYPYTVIVGQGTERLHTTATGRITRAVWEQNILRFTVTYPPGEQGMVLISPTSRPDEVRLDGRPIPIRTELEQGNEPGWRYEPGYAYLSIRIPCSGPVAVEVRRIQARPIARVPRLATQIAFEWNDSPEGWIPLHQVENFQVSDGLLHGEMTGADPYICRHWLRVPGKAAPVLRLRFRVNAGRTAQLFWVTETSPHFEEQKSLRFVLQADGQFHEYRLEVGKNPAWSEGVITALRLDPADHAGSFALDYLRAETD